MNHAKITQSYVKYVLTVEKQLPLESVKTQQILQLAESLPHLACEAFVAVISWAILHL